jgi:hypothetical protein
LEFGYWSEVEKKPKKPNSFDYSHGIYTYTQWAPWTEKDSVERDVALNSFPSEETFQKELRKLLKGTKTAILMRKRRCPQGAKRVLRQFKIP